jgi:hypothetical protein
MFTNAIEKGEDLTKLKGQLDQTLYNQDLTIEQWSQLNKVINDKLDFDNNVLKTDAYKNTLETYETSIKGFRKTTAAITATKSWYEDRNIVLGKETTALVDIIENNHPLSDSGTQMFKDRSFTKFQVMLVAELDDQYNTALKGATPEQASNYIQTNINDIAERVFRSWEAVVLTDVKKLNPQALSNLKLSN